MTTEYVELSGTVYMGFGLNDSAGADDADSTPVFDVRLAGATASDIPILSGNCTLLSHANYEKGNYEVGIACTSGNGFAADKSYLVYVSATVNTTVFTSMIGVIKTTPLTTARDLGQCLKTTVATVTSQTELKLTAGSGDNDAYNNCIVLLEDSDGDISVRHATDWVASTKSLHISSAPDFVVAATDPVRIFANTAPGQIETLDAVVDTVKADTAAALTRLPAALSPGGYMKGSNYAINGRLYGSFGTIAIGTEWPDGGAE